MPSMSESAKIAKIHYRYQVGENKERQDKYAKRLFAWLWGKTHWNVFWKLGYERYLAEWEKDRDLL